MCANVTQLQEHVAEKHQKTIKIYLLISLNFCFFADNFFTHMLIKYDEKILIQHGFS